MDNKVTEIVGFSIVLLILYVIILVASKREEEKELNAKKADSNIEWDGDIVLLKKKDYGELRDDFREKVLTDTEISKETKHKRIQNIQNKQKD